PGFAPGAARAGTAAVGLFLVFLGRGLRRAKRRAWMAAVLVSAVALALHLLRRADLEEAALAAVVLGLLVAGHSSFQARPDPRSARTVVVTGVTGFMCAGLVGWCFLWAMKSRQLAGTTALDRLQHVALGMFGVDGPVQFVDPDASDRAGLVLLLLGAAATALLLGVLLRPAGGPHHLRAEEETQLRTLLCSEQADSLGYFALRRDRSVIFSPSRKAAVSYRVVGGVSLAGGDPIGEPEAWPGAIRVWLDEARRYGWVPGVLGASERGALAYHRGGLDTLEIGDEAVLDLDSFTLEGRPMRPVRQALSRANRAGYRISCRRWHQLSDSEALNVGHATNLWRSGETERGFSMSLGRMNDPRDADCIVVTASSADGQLVAVQTYVPWGTEGLSLDLMRRDRTAVNGITEAMVGALATVAPSLGVRRLSLNFAVFRAALERGERLGAGPVTRLWRRVLVMASRWWQIEALYRSNAKFRPIWQPRFVCFQVARELPAVAVAGLRAEAFLQLPAWVRLQGRRHGHAADIHLPDRGPGVRCCHEAPTATGVSRPGEGDDDMGVSPPLVRQGGLPLPGRLAKRTSSGPARAPPGCRLTVPRPVPSVCQPWTVRERPVVFDPVSGGAVALGFLPSRAVMPGRTFAHDARWPRLGNRVMSVPSSAMPNAYDGASTSRSGMSVFSSTW
ncbi:MAG: phosphatidylglycerol lysyltransferase domain-containing protein, partial [Dermatophilaceae bacterium]